MTWKLFAISPLAVVGLLGGYSVAAQAQQSATNSLQPLAVFDRLCIAGQTDLVSNDVEEISWRRFPHELQLMNTYGHDGHFWRIDEPERTYVAVTMGEGHLHEGTEARCGVASRSLNYDEVVENLSERFDITPSREIQLAGTRMTMLASGHLGLTVMGVSGGWVIVRNTSMTIGVPPSGAEPEKQQDSQ